MMTNLQICEHIANKSEIFFHKMEQTTINGRVGWIIGLLEISQNAFAKALNTSSSRVSNIVSGRNKPDSDFLAALVKKFTDVNPAWLLTGEGQPLLTQSSSQANDKGYPVLDEPYGLASLLKEIDQRHAKAGIPKTNTVNSAIATEIGSADSESRKDIIAQLQQSIDYKTEDYREKYSKFILAKQQRDMIEQEIKEARKIADSESEQGKKLLEMCQVARMLAFGQYDLARMISQAAQMHLASLHQQLSQALEADADDKEHASE